MYGEGFHIYLEIICTLGVGDKRFSISALTHHLLHPLPKIIFTNLKFLFTNLLPVKWNEKFVSFFFPYSLVKMNLFFACQRLNCIFLL